MSRLHGLEDLRMRQEHALGRSGTLVLVEAECRPLRQAHAFAGQVADAKLGPLEIAQDSNRAAEVGLGGAHGPMQLLHRVER